MTKIIEEINKVINKVEKNLSDTLNRKLAEGLLEEIKTDLGTLEKNAEKSYGKVVNEKVKGIKSIIEKNLEEGANWTTTQDDLSKIKEGLVELKNEIERLAQQQTLQVPQKPQRPTFTETVVDHEQSYIDIAVKAGEREGILGMGAVAVLGTASVFTTGIGQLADNVQTDLKDLTDKGIDVGADITKQIVENFNVLDAGKNITDSLTDAGKNITDSLARGIGQEVKAKADSDARIAEADAKAKAEIARANADVEIAKIQAQTEAIKAQIELTKLNLNKK